MDPADLKRTLGRLAAAENAVARARERVGRQRALIARLEREGHRLGEAYSLLAALEAARPNHERCLAMLLKDLARRGWKLGNTSDE